MVLTGGNDATGCVGVLMLDTRFPRPMGDIGNPDTFAQLGITARHMIVRGAHANDIVRGDRQRWLAEFVSAAQALARQGCTLITTTCGFLAEFQPLLQQAVQVPVLSSALLQCAAHAPCGIVTFDASALTTEVLDAVGVPPGTPLEGLLPGCELQRVIYGDLQALDVDSARADVVQAAQRLCQRHPDLTTLVLECANMPPYRDAVAQATGCKVLDGLTLVQTAWRR